MNIILIFNAIFLNTKNCANPWPEIPEHFLSIVNGREREKKCFVFWLYFIHNSKIVINLSNNLLSIFEAPIAHLKFELSIFSAFLCEIFASLLKECPKNKLKNHCDSNNNQTSEHRKHWAIGHYLSLECMISQDSGQWRGSGGGKSQLQCILGKTFRGRFSFHRPNVNFSIFRGYFMEYLVQICLLRRRGFKEYRIPLYCPRLSSLFRCRDVWCRLSTWSVRMSVIRSECKYQLSEPIIWYFNQFLLE